MKLEQWTYQAEIFANRVKKNYAHLRKRFTRQNIDCFRLYDWDIPEIRAVVDWYAGHLVIAEYVRQQSQEGWLPEMASAVARALDVPKEKVFIKRRQTKEGRGSHYQRVDKKAVRLIVHERELKFWVNLSDFLDTGLYSDHRETRKLIRSLSNSKNFLNLFAYSGAFTCAAISGGAQTSLTVDRSATNLQWAQENLQLNGLSGARHGFVQSDVEKFLQTSLKKQQKYDLIFIDPPSFFNDKTTGKSFDINKNHPDLLNKVISLAVPRGTIFFSTNHQRFEPKFEGLKVRLIKELTPQTIPDDYRNKKIHRCWRMEAGGS